jgi:branched-chain amino acid transport system substrate-binding protein
MTLLASMSLTGNVFAAASHNGLQTVTICSSVPFSAPSLTDLSQGIQNGVNLAIHWQASALKKAGLKVNYMPLDDGNAGTGSYDTSKEAQNADTCLGVSNSLGYIGTLNSGAAQVSEPKLNKAHMAMISPSNTNPGLTDPKNVNGFGGRTTTEPCSTPVADSCPSNNKIKYVTYHRVVTTDALQGPAGAQFGASQFKAKSYALVDDNKPYGVGLAGYFATEAAKLKMKQIGHYHIDSTNGGTEASSSLQISTSITTGSKKPDIVYCGCDEETSGGLARDLRTANYNKPWLGGDAFVTTDWFSNTKGAGSGATNSWATSVGPDTTKAAKFFVTLYKKYYPKYFKSPGPQAYDALSFDAAGVLLTAIIEAKKAGKLKGTPIAQRTAVVGYVQNIKFTGATGKTTFDKNGDTTNKIISIYKANTNAGAWKFLKQFVAKGNPAP